MNRPNTYEYCKQCTVWMKYENLCFMNPKYSAEQRRLFFGDSCPVADEDKVVPEFVNPIGMHNCNPTTQEVMRSAGKTLKEQMEKEK